MHMGIICVFSGKRQQNTKYFCRTYPAVFCHFCRTNLALSDISRDFWSFLSDTSSCGHIWLCRTYLAGTGPTLFFVHVTSQHNDLATNKILLKFGTTLFGYLRTRSMTFVSCFFQTVMSCIYLVRAMSQLHFKTIISSLSQLGAKL